jgi:transcription initiation factor TFIIIB Brf1 subunit/transcription initiation factor TFIIB
MVLKNELDELEKIEEDASLPVHLLERKTFIQTELMRLLEEEEMYWHKRSNELGCYKEIATQAISIRRQMERKGKISSLI